MIKLIFMLKRRPGMSREEFVEHYESTHAKLGRKHVTNAARYVRRYLQALPDALTGVVMEPDYDVITELWFENQSDMDWRWRISSRKRFRPKSRKTRRSCLSGRETACTS